MERILETTSSSRKMARTTGMVSPHTNNDNNTSSPAKGGGSGNTTTMVLMKPTVDRPWLVEVTAALPVHLLEPSSSSHEINPEESPLPSEEDEHRPSSSSFSSTTTTPLSTANQCVRVGPWMAMVSGGATSDHTSHDNHPSASGFQVHVWYTAMPGVSSWKEQKFDTPVLTLRHASWTTACPLSPLIALQAPQRSTPHNFQPQAAAASHGTAATSPSTSSIWLYVLRPSNGSLWLWKLHTFDLLHSNKPLMTSTMTSMRVNGPAPPAYKSLVTLPLLTSKDGSHDDNETDSTAPSPVEVVTCLTASSTQSYLLVGTSRGRVFWIRQCHGILQVELVPYATTAKTNESSSSSSLFSWMSWNARSNANTPLSEEAMATTTPSRFLRHVLFLGTMDSSTTTNNNNIHNTSTLLFGTVSRAGELVVYQAVRGSPPPSSSSSTGGREASHSATTMTQFGVVAPPQSLWSLLQSWWSSSSSPSALHLVSLHVEQAAAAAATTTASAWTTTGQDPCPQLFVVVRVQVQASPNTTATAMGEVPHGNQPHTDSATSGVVVEDRLVWVCLELQQPGRVPSKESLSLGGWAVSTVTWLDRFTHPSLVSVVGLQVTDNGVAYAAMVVVKQQPNNNDNDNDESVEATRDPSTSTDSTATRRSAILMAHDRVVPSTQQRHQQQQPLSSQVVLLHEVDLEHLWMDDTDENSHLVVGGLFTDDTTYGCTLVAPSGTLIRVECKEASELVLQQQQQEAIRHDSSQSVQEGVSPVLRRSPNHAGRKVSSLVNHLRSVYWDSYQNPPGTSSSSITTPTLPPSIFHADKLDLELAIVKLGLELQKADSLSSVAVLSRHLFLVEFLQRAGLYRSLMPGTKWRLMAMGQEIAAYQAVLNSASMTVGHMEMFLESLTPHEMAKWLGGVQSHVILARPEGEDQQQQQHHHQDEESKMVFCTWLEQALSAALNFRTERCTVTYDIASTAKPPRVDRLDGAGVPIWTSQYGLSQVLGRQLNYWNNQYRPETATQHQVEVVAKAGLACFRDIYLACPSEANKVGYAEMMSRAIEVLRKVCGKERDGVAWSLCMDHAYFWGLCEIARQHRNERGSDFQLPPLVNKFHSNGVVDIATDMSFSQYMLKWHIERNLVGEALKYGQTTPLCQDDLYQMMSSEPSLQPYRWILAVQRGDFNSATGHLMDVVERGGANLSLKQAKFNLAMAKLTNKVSMRTTANQAMATERARVIENQREIAQAQQELLGNDVATSTAHGYHWSAESLLDYAMNKIDKLISGGDKEEMTKTCIIALILCASLDHATPTERTNAAVKVWHKALLADWEFLNRLIHTSISTSASCGNEDWNSVVDQCVFGRVVSACDEMKSLGENVGIDGVLDPWLVDRLVAMEGKSRRNRLDGPLIHRFLQSVLTSVRKS